MLRNGHDRAQLIFPSQKLPPIPRFNNIRASAEAYESLLFEVHFDYRASP